MVTARFRSQLQGNGTPQWVTDFHWSNDGGRSWREAVFVDGTCTNSQIQQIRWTSSITVADAPFAEEDRRWGIESYHTRFRLRRGIRYSPHEKIEWVGMGVYRCKDARRSSTVRGEIEIEGESFESYVQRARIYQPRTIPSQSARDMIENPRGEYRRRRGLITEVLQDAQFDWHPGVDQDLVIPQLVAVDDRWATIAGSRDSRSIEQALAARIFTNGEGIWRIEPVPSLQDDPEWVIDEDPITGVSLGAAEHLTSDGVYNVEVVTGTAGGQMIGPGIAKDTDPNSPTYVGKSIDDGGFGEIAAPEYLSQMVTSQAQCELVARARLANRLGLRRSFTFGMLHNPLIRAGQVGAVRAFGSRNDQVNKIIIDSVPFDLGPNPGPMQCQTRTQQTRLAGAISEVIADLGDEGVTL